MKSIRAALTLGLLAGFALLLAAGGAALYFTVRSVLVGEFDSALQAKAEALAALTRREGEHLELEFAEELMPAFAGGSHPAFFQLWRPDGQVLERSPLLGRADLPLPVARVRAPVFWDLALPSARPGRAVGFTFVPQVEDDDAVSADSAKPSLPATVVVAVERAGLDRQLSVIAAATMGFAVTIAAAAAVLALMVIRRSLAPLEELTEGVREIDASTLGSRFPLDRLPAELKPICERLNELLSRLQSAFDRERSFSADVAHELRTPVAELRALAEVAVKWPAGNAEAQEGFADALAIAEQMDGIVNGLLVMARCDSGIEEVHGESIALGPFLRETWRSFAAQAERKEIAVRFDISPDTRVESDRALLRIMLMNFLSNAVEYSPERGELRVSEAPNGNEISLRIANSAPELTSADLPYVFERFWRKSNARTSSNRAGLGLSISRAVAQLLGTQLRADIPEPGIFAITLILPTTTRVPRDRPVPQATVARVR